MQAMTALSGRQAAQSSRTGGFAGYNAGMPELIILAIVWCGVLWYVARVDKDKMQATWLVLIGLLLASPVLAMIWPFLR
jgi:hypothetical protein